MTAISPIRFVDLQPATQHVVPKKAIEEFKADYPQAFQSTRLQKIGRLAYNIFSVLFFPLGICRLIGYYLHLKIGERIVPAQVMHQDEEQLKLARESLIKDFNGSPVSMTTPDGKRLDGMHVPGKKEGQSVSKQAPTLILFNGNGSRYELANEAIKITASKNEQEKVTVTYPLSNLSHFVELGYNVLLFNYRGVGASQGRATRDGLILDGATALQYVQKKFQVPNEKIILFGHSLGGAIATQIAAMNDKVNLCHVRSFSSLEKVVRVRFKNGLGAVAAKILSMVNWALDTAGKWGQVKGRKWVVYHPQDAVIPFEASQFKALQECKQPFNGVEMKNREAVRAYYEKQVASEKNRELINSERLVDQIVEEIEDPHNRALLPEEVKEIVALWV